MHKLINFLNGHIHAVVCGNVPFKLQKVAPNIVDVHEGKLFMDVVLSYVNVEVKEAVLVETRGLRSWPYVAGHRIRHYR